MTQRLGSSHSPVYLTKNNSHVSVKPQRRPALSFGLPSNSDSSYNLLLCLCMCVFAAPASAKVISQINPSTGWPCNSLVRALSAHSHPAASRPSRVVWLPMSLCRALFPVLGGFLTHWEAFRFQCSLSHTQVLHVSHDSNFTSCTGCTTCHLGPNGIGLYYLHHT